MDFVRWVQEPWDFISWQFLEMTGLEEYDYRYFDEQGQIKVEAFQLAQLWWEDLVSMINLHHIRPYIL